jgi:hypothetical protein
VVSASDMLIIELLFQKNVTFAEGSLRLSNGLIAREFTTQNNNLATIDLYSLEAQSSLIRLVFLKKGEMQEGFNPIPVGYLKVH